MKRASLVVLWLVAACGGSLIVAVDAGQGGDASDAGTKDVLEAWAFPTDPQPPGPPPPDVPPPYIVVDGGACDASFDGSAVRTCCVGSVCPGFCVLTPDASAPFCMCAGLAGGCPEPAVCCKRVTFPYTECMATCPRVGLQ